jgi:hypothetical protein
MGRRVNPILLRACAAFCALSTGLPAAAQTKDDEGVLLAFETQRDAGESFAKALEAQLAGTGIQLAVVWGDAPESDLREQLETARAETVRRGALSAFWYLDVSETEGLLCITGATGARLLVRRLIWSSGEARAETLAVIVSSALDVLRRGGTIGVVEPVLAIPDPPPQAVVPYVPPPKPLVLGVEAAAVYQARSEPIPAMFGFDAVLVFRPIPALVLRAGFTLWNRATAEGSLADIELRRFPYRLGAAYEAHRGALGFGGGLSVVLDDAHQRTVEIRTGDPLAATRSNRDLVVSLVPEIAIRYAAVPRLEMSISAGVEIPLNRVSYRYYGASRVETIEVAWSVQPRVAVGVRVWLF